MQYDEENFDPHQAIGEVKSYLDENQNSLNPRMKDLLKKGIDNINATLNGTVDLVAYRKKFPTPYNSTRAHYQRADSPHVVVCADLVMKPSVAYNPDVFEKVANVTKFISKCDSSCPTSTLLF
jgi:hypothetical protein